MRICNRWCRKRPWCRRRFCKDKPVTIAVTPAQETVTAPEVIVTQTEE